MKQIKKLRQRARRAVRLWVICGCPEEFVPRRAILILDLFVFGRIGLVFLAWLLGPWVLAFLLSWLW